MTPIGNDARATWRAAVAGESGVDFIRAFDASGFPVRIAAEVKDFDASSVASPKEVRKLERNVLLALGADEVVGPERRSLGPAPHRDHPLSRVHADGQTCRPRCGDRGGNERRIERGRRADDRP